MLPADWLSSIQAYALNRDSLPSGASSPAGDLVPLSELLNVGQTVQGIVATQGAGNLFLVKIAGQTVQLPLPGAYPAGSPVSLKVLTVSPQLTFSLSEPPVASAALSPQSTTTQLGATAQWIADLAQGATPMLSGGVNQSLPLLAAMTALDPAQLAQSLYQSLATSGLFYEAHQAQWVNGQQTTAHLRLQPQNQPAPTASSAGGAPAPAVMPGAGSMAQSHAGGVAPTTPLAGAAPTMAAEGNVAVPVPSHLLGLVQQQLAILESGRIVWQGHLAQDQPLQWQLWPDGSMAQQPVAATWHTQLQLELPTLGTVAAHLTLDSQGVRMRLAAERSDTRKTLVQQRATLVEALSQVGIVVLAADVVPPGDKGGQP